MERGKVDLGAALLPLVTAGFAAALLFFSRENNPTAALFPRVVGVATLAFVLLDLIINRTGIRHAAPPEGRASGGRLPAWGIPLALQAVYLALIYVIGFSLATFVFLLLCPLVLGYRRPAVVAAHAVLFTAVLVFTFQSVFHIRLPKGLIGFPW
ncbi:MAG TPA: tripartite tricarboxylate transporter TctB family protein [candidate division Zixibacteria bacterium]|nr:tripartite tricarboxylate transporter TctB family protein [candidate division Zixibacteria bacterium]